MTYLARARPRRTVRRRRGMGDWSDPIVPQSGCIDDANAQVASLDAQTLDLAKNWNPTGFYSPADVQRLVTQTMALISSATDAVGQAPRSTADAETQIQQALDTLFQKGQKALVYTQAIGDAAKQGKDVINASGLKGWVLDSMNAASNALVTSAVLECNTPWLASAVMALAPLFAALAGVAKSVVNAVLKIGETALKIAEDLPEIWTIVKWGTVAAVSIWALLQLANMRPRRDGG